jgi:hypothetical protein
VLNVINGHDSSGHRDERKPQIICFHGKILFLWQACFDFHFCFALSEDLSLSKAE